MIRVLLCLLLVSCANPGSEQKRIGGPTPPLLSALATWAAENYAEVSGPAGFIDTDHCDSLQHSSLVAAAGAPVELDRAQGRPGEWFRRPLTDDDGEPILECWSIGKSRSTVTRDQLLGVMWAAWSARDPAHIRNLWSFGSRRNWVMGSDALGGLHTLMTYNDIVLLAKLCRALDAGCSGNWALYADAIPKWSATSPKGFERQLEVLRISLMWEVDGREPFGGLDRLWRHAGEQAWNPLFVAALVRFGGVDPLQVDARLRAAGYPEGRFPTSADWCSEWLVETEDGSKPCPEEGRTHSGGELIFMHRLISGSADVLRGAFNGGVP
jgi:hypothetical protein